MFPGFGFSVDEVLNPIEVYFEIEQVGQPVQTQVMQAPQMFIQQQFLEFVQQAAQANFSVRIKMYRMDEVYNDWKDTYKTMEYSIEFKNKAWLDNHDE